MLGRGAKIMNNFRYARSAILEAIHMLPQINTSTVVKKGNGTERRQGKSMMHTLYILWMAKSTSLAEATSYGEKMSP